MPSIDVAPEYGYVILVAIATSFHCTIQSFYVSKVRYTEAFTEDYLHKNYSAENEAHKKEFGTPLKRGGHPDNGLGYLSTKLGFLQWIKLQNAQRAHLNYTENLTGQLSQLLLAGLFFPVTAAGLGAVQLVGRQLYCSAYRAKGPNARGPGFGLATLPGMANMGMAIY